MESGEEIANENPDVKEDMLAAVDEVRSTGTWLRKTESGTFENNKNLNSKLL